METCTPFCVGFASFSRSAHAEPAPRLAGRSPTPHPERGDADSPAGQSRTAGPGRPRVMRCRVQGRPSLRPQAPSRTGSVRAQEDGGECLGSLARSSSLFPVARCAPPRLSGCLPWPRPRSCTAHKAVTLVCLALGADHSTLGSRASGLTLSLEPVMRMFTHHLLAMYTSCRLLRTSCKRSCHIQTRIVTHNLGRSPCDQH